VPLFSGSCLSEAILGAANGHAVMQSLRDMHLFLLTVTIPLLFLVMAPAPQAVKHAGSAQWLQLITIFSKTPIPSDTAFAVYAFSSAHVRGLSD
jgi:hypothetical protein